MPEINVNLNFDDEKLQSIVDSYLKGDEITPEKLTLATDILTKAINSNQEIAFSWYCVIKMAAHDVVYDLVPHEERHNLGDQVAEGIMKTCFGYDISNLENRERFKTDTEVDEGANKFRVNRYYRHANKRIIKTHGEIDSYFYGVAIVSEDLSGAIDIICPEQESFIGWEEISESEWLDNFQPKSPSE